MANHADLLDHAYWQSQKERIKAGYVHDVFPYDRSRRFKNLMKDASKGAEGDELVPVDEPVDVKPMGMDVHDQGRLTGFTAGGSGND